MLLVKIKNRIQYEMMKCLPDKAFLLYQYKKRTGQKLNLSNPRTFNEKLQYKKLYDRNPLYTVLADKYRVREYVKARAGEKYLIPLLGVWNNEKQIEEGMLPDRFVLKCNHDSGSVFICRDKKEFDFDACRKQIHRALKKNYFWPGREWAYKNIKRCVIAEKYIEESGHELRDYKFFCFHGRAEFIQVDIDRHTDHTRNIYTREWELLDVSVEYPRSSVSVKRPQNLEEMIQVAERLSKGLNDVRVDLYNINDRQVFFGEMTLYHGSGTERIEPEEFDCRMGRLMQPPRKNKAMNKNRQAVTVYQDKNIRDYSDVKKIEDIVTETFLDHIERTYGHRDIKKVFLPGRKVVVKPNFVHELNFRVRFDGKQMENPNDCFITDWSVVRAVVRLLSRTDHLQISILECPLQSCRIEKIVTKDMLDELAAFNRTNRIAFIDARRTKYIIGRKEPEILHNCRDGELYIDFDLGRDSLHAPYDKYADRFRVTDYPPEEMAAFHGKGMHRYRIAREVMEADYVISVPKLKTHMKAGMTCAMKNMVGIVGNKECLPHHTAGAPWFWRGAGDCYGDFSVMKMIAEKLTDDANRYLASDEKTYYKKTRLPQALLALRRLLCMDPDITGSWYGNDTISRTIVDLNHILYYGGTDGKMHDRMQRKVFAVVDGIVSGQGEGPMRPVPNYTGLLAVSESSAAADIVCAEMIGLDSSRIHCLYQDRICTGRWPLSARPGQLQVFINGEKISYSELRRMGGRIMVPPRWEGKIEKHKEKEFSYVREFVQNLAAYPRRVVRKITSNYK